MPYQINTSSLSDSVIIERFSAPGGPEINSLAYLDLASSRYSVYNALPWRNLSVRSSGSGETGSIRASNLGRREGLRTLQQRYAGKFGLDSQYGVVSAVDYVASASFHKQARNRFYRLTSGAVTSSQHDNDFFVFAFPRQINNNYWVTASAVNLPAGYITGNAGVVFVSAAHEGYSFLGLEHNIDDPLSLVNQTVGTGLSPTGSGFRELIAGRGGPYQGWTWTQVRTGEHPVARKLRENSIISVVNEPPTIKVVSGSSVRRLRGLKPNTFTQYTEPVVVERFRPMVHRLEGENKYRVVHSYGNNLSLYSSTDLAERQGNTERPPQAYDSLYRTYRPSARELVGALPQGWSGLLYKEKIFPAEKNTFLQATRTRSNFSPGWWASKRLERLSVPHTNSQGVVLAGGSSIWPLDGRLYYETTASTISGVYNRAGELQNSYTQYAATGAAWNSISFGFDDLPPVPFSSRMMVCEIETGDFERPTDKEYTIAMWVKANASTRFESSSFEYGLAVQGDSFATPNFALVYNGTQQVVARIGDGDDVVASVPAGEWHHIVLTHDLSADRDFLYVDGILEDFTTTGAGSGLTAHTNPIWLGMNLADTNVDPKDTAKSAGFYGYMTQVTFWTTALDGAEITDLYNGGCLYDDLSAHDQGTELQLAYGPFVGLVSQSLGSRGQIILDPDPNSIQNATASLWNVFETTIPDINKDYGMSRHKPCSNPFPEVKYGQLYNFYQPEMAYSSGSGTPEYRERAFFAGDAKWEGNSGSNRLPYDEDHDIVRYYAKGYSLLPEYRASEHIDYHLSSYQGNFLQPNPGYLTLTGTITASSATSSFYNRYSISDPLKYFDEVELDHSDITGQVKVKLTCNAVLKMVPYDGFFPVLRAVQLGGLFSQSYGSFVNNFSGSNPDRFGSKPSFRTFLTPFFAPGLFYNSIKSGLAVDFPIMTSSFSVTGTVTYAVGQGEENEYGSPGSVRINENYHERIPFEAIVDPSFYVAGKPIHDLIVHPSGALDSTASWYGGGDIRYSLAVNNFLAETADFFLSNGELTKIESALDNDRGYFLADADKEYRMRVVLSSGELSYYEDILAQSGTAGDQRADDPGSVFTRPTITMYDRPSAFGPPTAAPSVERLESFSPYTPPYYDGYAHAEYVFRPKETKRYTAAEVLNEVTASYRRVGQAFFTGTTPSVAELNRMQVSASVNADVVRLKNVVYDEFGNVVSVEDDPNAPSAWVFQTKWETPILDFSQVSAATPFVASASAGVAGPTGSVGMWHQYGAVPSPDKGVFLRVQNLKNSDKDNPARTGSLAELVGFNLSPQRVGNIAESKIIREAVVAVPFVEDKSGDRTFMAIDRVHINDALGRPRKKTDPTEEQLPLARKSVREMVRKMTLYNIPLRLDFIKREDITPFAMYIFEFEYELSQRDLVNIWQNVSPDIAYTHKPASREIEHLLDPGELMMTGGAGLQDRLRWMIFKVKWKAAKNYYSKLADSFGDPRYKFNFQVGGSQVLDIDNSYNWPYDFFSLVELAEIEAEVELIPTDTAS